LDLSDHRDEMPILHSGVAASLAGTNGDMKGA